MGLDVFGHAPNFVSPLSYQYLKKATEDRFKIATDLESAHNTYLDKLSKLQDASAELQTAISLVARTRNQLTQDRGQYASVANQAQDDIQTMSITLSTLTAKLQEADYEFQDRVSSLGGCSLGQMIEFVVGVIAICYGVYVGVTAVADSMNKVNSAPAGSGIITSLKIIGETFDKSKVSEQYQKMQAGFKEVEDALKNNTTKIVVSMESFETQLEPYLNMPEAVRYRDLMRQIVDLAKARNDRMLSYTEALLKSTEAQAQSDALEMESDRISRVLAQTNNPALADCVTYLTGYLISTKRGLLELLDLQRRALMYISLLPITPSYQWTIVSTLKDTQALLDQKMVDAAAARGREEQTYSADFSLTRAANTAFFDLLQKNGDAAFSIPLDDQEFNRGGTSFVTVFEVNFDAPGIASKTGNFTCRLTQQGNSTFRDADGNLMNFSHAKRPTILSFSKSGTDWKPTFDIANNLGGSESEYLYLSPFAGWTLRVTGNDGVDWSKVHAIKLSFRAKTIPSNRLQFNKAVREIFQ